MAAAGARFSIREYAARARMREEGGSCWPFGGEAGALPPMEARRFRWWADEAAAVEEEEREVERRMAAKRRKRSVAELFAAVPRVAGGKGKKRAVNGMQANKGKVALTAEVKASNGFKKKVPNGIAVSKKEKSGSVKAMSVSMLQDSMRMRKLTKSLGKDKRNQEASVLLNNKSRKRNNNSVLDSKKNAIKSSVQAQSIFLKQSKMGFSTVKDNTDITSKLNSSVKPKHVTFSDDMFGWTAPLPENNTQQPQSVQTSQQPSQEGHNQHSEDELQLVSQQADAIPGAIEEDTSSLSEIIVSSGAFCTFPVAKPKDGTIIGNSVDRNHCTKISNSSNYLNSFSLAYLSSKMPSQNIDGVDSHLDNDEDCLDAECLREENHVIQQGSSNPDSLAVNGIYGDIYKSILSQPSSSCLDDRRRSTLPERMIANRQLGKVHRKFVSSGKDLMNSISSSAGSKKSSDERAMDCVPACGNNYFSDDYVSLPLNSRGEFVNLHPGGSPSSVNISKRQCLGESSSHPSASPAFYNPTTSTDHVNLRPNHHAPKFYATDQSPYFTPTVPTEYQMDFRQLPCSKRMENCKYSIPSNKYPCTNQQDISAACFSSECMKCHNPHPKLLGMQSGCMRQDWEQNTQSTSETTVRLMGKTVTLGTSSIQCRDLNNESPGSCKQVQAKDHSFQGMYRKTFPQLFHREMADPASAFRIPHGKRELSENPSFFSADELRSELDTNSFRTNGYNEQPVLPAANNLYVQPATWCNKGELRQPIMPNQAQSSAEDMLLASMHRRNTQNVASVPCLNRRNSVRNFMEKIPAPYQPGYFTQKFSNMTQRNLTSSSLSGYAAVQNSTTQTKFTSLPPLPPSLAPSRIRSLDYAQHRGTNTSTFNPSIPAVHQTSRSGAPGNVMPRDERLKWAVMGSNVEGSGQLNQNGKRPAERDDAFLTSPKKACTASGKDSNLLSGQFCRSRFAGARPVDMPVGLSPGPGLGSRDARTTWSYPVSTVGPVKLKPGVRHIVEPSASVMEQSIPWAVNSVTPIAVSTSKIETQKPANSNHVWQ